MRDRRFIGDVMLAVLIAIPSVSFERQGAVSDRDAPALQKSEIALAPVADRHTGLFG